MALKMNERHIEQFRQNYLFEHLDSEELARVADHANVVQLARGEILFSQDDPCHHFYMVQSGMIKLHRLSADGSEKVMALIGPMQAFAETVMFVGRYPLYAAALEASTLFAFDCKEFLNHLRSNIELCFRLMAGMSRRMHGLIDEIDQLSLHNGTQRLVQYLLEQMPQGVGRMSCINLSVPKSVIASRLGIQPETFSRMMAKLRSDGLIEIQGDSTILLRDAPALRRLLDTPNKSSSNRL